MLSPEVVDEIVHLFVDLAADLAVKAGMVGGRGLPAIRSGVWRDPTAARQAALRAALQELDDAAALKVMRLPGHLKLAWKVAAACERLEDEGQEGPLPERLRALRVNNLRPGDVLGDSRRYRIARKIGKGAFAEVYLASALDGPVGWVAVKLCLVGRMRPLARRERDNLQAVKLVASTRARPSPVPLFIELVETPHYSALVMEHIPGQTLRDVINARHDPTRSYNRGFDTMELRALTRQLLHGLDVIHAADLVHRDLKPENIILSGVESPPESWQVRIVDLALGRKDSSKSRQASLSLGTAGFGTEAYMAPEQRDDDGVVRPCTDLFTLALVVHECASGQSPGPGSRELRRADQGLRRFHRHAHQMEQEKRPRSATEALHLMHRRYFMTRVWRKLIVAPGLRKFVGKQAVSWTLIGLGSVGATLAIGQAKRAKAPDLARHQRPLRVASPASRDSAREEADRRVFPVVAAAVRAEADRLLRDGRPTEALIGLIDARNAYPQIRLISQMAEDFRAKHAPLKPDDYVTLLRRIGREDFEKRGQALLEQACLWHPEAEQLRRPAKLRRGLKPCGWLTARERGDPKPQPPRQAAAARKPEHIEPQPGASPASRGSWQPKEPLGSRRQTPEQAKEPRSNPSRTADDSDGATAYGPAVKEAIALADAAARTTNLRLRIRLLEQANHALPTSGHLRLKMRYKHRRAVAQNQLDAEESKPSGEGRSRAAPAPPTPKAVPAPPPTPPDERPVVF